MTYDTATYDRVPKNPGSQEDFTKEVMPHLQARYEAQEAQRRGIDPTVLAMSVKPSPDTVAAIHDAVIGRQA